MGEGLKVDYKNPDYREEYERRMEMLVRLRKNPALLEPIKAHYKANPIQFVRDWGTTSDPRNLERNLPVLVPFIPFPRQVDWMEWILERKALGENGLTEKSRDAGCSVTFMSLMCALALTNRDFVAGVGSRKEMLVDGVADPNTLFYKADTFMRYLPPEFREGYSPHSKLHRSHMKLWIPNTNSIITGEAGDNIGRGGRATIYGVDESAHIKNQNSIDMALSQTTRTRIDFSSVNGSDNAFAEKRHSGRVPIFTFHWRDDPRKDQAWYDRECERLPAVIVAQELDINYNASKDNILIPSDWVQAAIGLEIPGANTGRKIAGMDVADRGEDSNALTVRDGPYMESVQEWSGKGSDIFESAAKCALMLDGTGCETLRFDADGLGVGLRGDFRVLNETRKHKIDATEHRGSGGVVDPEEYVIDPDIRGGNKGRTNSDFFENYKAQSWWALRSRFERTFKYVTRGIECDPDTMISLPKDMPMLGKLTQELSQPTYKLSTTGKILVVKAPDGTKSPNLADSVVIAYAPEKRKRMGALDF